MGSPELTGQHYDPPNEIRFDTLERQGTSGSMVKGISLGASTSLFLVRIEVDPPLKSYHRETNDFFTFRIVFLQKYRTI